MALTGVHFLLSYQCTHECDHCFVWASPRAGGTISLGTLLSVLDQAQEVGTVKHIYFEGGEPFLFYPLLVEGIRQAAKRGLSTGVVTNCYWATAEPDAALWLEPLQELGVADLSLSSDAFHAGEVEDPRPGFAREAARRLGLDEAVITIDPPTVCINPEDKGRPIIGGSVRFRGRAVAELVEDLPAGRGPTSTSAQTRTSSTPAGCMWTATATCTSARASCSVTSCRPRWGTCSTATLPRHTRSLPPWSAEDRRSWSVTSTCRTKTATLMPATCATRLEPPFGSDSRRCSGLRRSTAWRARAPPPTNRWYRRIRIRRRKGAQPGILSGTATASGRIGGLRTPQTPSSAPDPERKR